MSLEDYEKKRDFKKTPEPKEGTVKKHEQAQALPKNLKKKS